MEDILNAIIKDTYSLGQLKHRLRILKANLVKSFFGSTEDIPLSAQDLKWLRSLPQDFYQKFNKNNVYQIFTDLEEQSKKFTILVIYLTFEPDETTLAQIGSFSRKLFSSPMLLDIKLDPNLIAGAALVWKGVNRDYSLRSKIEEKKGEILGGFKKFLR